MRDDIVPGATFPDYELPDHTDTPRKLSDLQGGDPMVLVLVRGYFCPKDRRQLKDLLPFHHRCRVGYTRLVTISSDDSVMELDELRMGVGACWPFLYDADRIIADDLEIREYTDRKHEPMIPHTLVLRPGLVVHRVWNGYWYWGRPAPDELHRELREVSRDVRPDWRIDTPEMRLRWEDGDREAFFPYGGDMPEDRC